MPSEAHSMPSTRVNDTTPPFGEQYGARPGSARLAAAEARLTIEPDRCSAIARPAAWAQAKVPPQVDVDDVPPRITRHLERRGNSLDARAVDEHVEPAVLSG